MDAIRSNFLNDDVPLDLLRENVIKDLLHLVPELCLLVFQMGSHDVVAFEFNVRVTGVAEVAIGPAI